MTMTESKPSDVDAFVDDKDAEAAENAVNRPGMEANPDPDAPAYEMGGTLQDLKVSAARNGANYDATFEVGVEYIDDLATAARDGHDVYWRGRKVGAGVSLRRLSLTRDADDALHLKIVLHMSESEIPKSIGWMGPLVAQHGVLKIQPMQMPLDLTTRAE